MDWKQRARQLFRIGISVGLVAWLLQTIDGSNLLARLAGANLLLLLLMMLFANLDRLLMAYKWNLLLRAKGVLVPMLEAFSVYYRASFLGMLILPTVGADAMRIFEVSRRTGRSEEVVSSVVIERMIGLLAMGLVCILSLSLFIGQLNQGGWQDLLALAAALACVGLVFALSMRRRWQALVAPPLLRARWGPARKLGQTIVAYQGYSAHLRVMVVFTLYSVLEQFISVITAYLVALALHIDVPLVYFLVFVPIITTFTRLPISFDGFGVREGLYVYLFGLAGVTQANAFLIGLLSSVLWRIGTALPALYFFLSQRSAGLAAGPGGFVEDAAPGQSQ